MQPQYSRDLLHRHFSLDELNDLCARLDVDYEDLRGQTRREKSHALFEYLVTRGRLLDLFETLSCVRPRLKFAPCFHELIAQSYRSDTEGISQLFASLDLEIRDFQEEERYTWGSIEWINDKAKKLQLQFSESRQWAQLLEAVANQRRQDLQPEKIRQLFTIDYPSRHNDNPYPKRIPLRFWGTILISLLFVAWLYQYITSQSPSDTPEDQPALTDQANTLTPSESPVLLTPLLPLPTNAPTHTPSLDLLFANGQLGDKWLRPQDSMIMHYVPSSETPFLMKSGINAPITEYWVDRYEVTNAQYALCVIAGRCRPSAYINDRRFNGDSYPVVGISWYDAQEYIEWLNQTSFFESGWEYALPTEEQWEYAAVGKSMADYPWGNEFDGTRLNFCDTNCQNDWRDNAWDDGYAFTSPVGNFPEGASWVGALDMAGNAWEWTSSWYDSYQTWPVVRGGAWFYDRFYARAAFRSNLDPTNRGSIVGFRVVLNRSPSGIPPSLQPQFRDDS
jgi:hypothetical protein